MHGAQDKAAHRLGFLAGATKYKKELNDGWTIVTKDHSLSARREHTELVTDTGYEIMTQSAGTPPPPAIIQPMLALA